MFNQYEGENMNNFIELPNFLNDDVNSSDKNFIPIPSFLSEDIIIQNNNIVTTSCEYESPCTTWCEIGCLGEGWCEPIDEGGCDDSCQECLTCLSGGCQGTCQTLCESGCLGCQNQQPITTLPTPYLDTSKTIKTQNSISITIIPVPNATSYIVELSKAGIIIGTFSGSELTYNLTGLTPATQYTIRICCSAVGYYNSDWNTYTATTIIGLWEWYTPKISGGNFNLSADEWNDFCDRINQMRIAKGQTLYSFTTANSNSPFYAYMFRQAANTLDGYGISAELKNVVSDDKIFAWYFTNLKASLNNAISTI